jgi:hypothetical protein
MNKTMRLSILASAALLSLSLGAATTAPPPIAPRPNEMPRLSTTLSLRLPDCQRMLPKI